MSLQLIQRRELARAQQAGKSCCVSELKFGFGERNRCRRLFLDRCNQLCRANRLLIRRQLLQTAQLKDNNALQELKKQKQQQQGQLRDLTLLGLDSISLCCLQSTRKGPSIHSVSNDVRKATHLLAGHHRRDFLCGEYCIVRDVNAHIQNRILAYSKV